MALHPAFLTFGQGADRSYCVLRTVNGVLSGSTRGACITFFAICK